MNESCPRSSADASRAFGDDRPSSSAYAPVQAAPPVNERGVVSSAHRMVQLAFVPQLTLQLAVHATWQSAPSPQDTLPLAPTVTSHVESGAQLMLHDSAQVPRQTLAPSHASEQLPPAPQVLGVKSHVVPPAHEQLAPEHVGARALLQPPAQSAATAAIIAVATIVVRIVDLLSYH